MAAVTNLRITSAAAEALRQTMSRITDYHPVATVVWSVSGAIETPRTDGTVFVKGIGPGWDVAFYDISRVPSGEVVLIEGIKFYFDQGSTSERLNGATLDYRSGFFAVEDAAI